MVEGLMNDIVSNSKIKVEECDYLKDDVWYCGKCNTPKQRVITVGGITSKVMMLCECKTIERDKYDEEVRIKDEQKRIRDMRSVGFSEVEMKNWTFENDDNLRSHSYEENIHIRIRKADYYIKAISRKEQSFFSTIRKKMMWGADSRL